MSGRKRSLLLFLLFQLPYPPQMRVVEVVAELEAVTNPRRDRDDVLHHPADLATDDVKTMTFEAALAELEGIVARLEGGKAPLAESIAIYERGEALKSHCEGLLKAAEARIEKITLKNGKPVGTEPLDP